MKILGILSIFLLSSQYHETQAQVTNTICLGGCKCQNTRNSSLEVSNCSKSINITSELKKSEVKTSEDGFTFLSIRFNRVIIDNIADGSFNSFTDLEHLEFNASEIKAMPPQTFLKDDLSSLAFTGCKFSEPPVIQCLGLEELVITDCNLKRVPKLQDLPSLTNLHLDGNRFNAIKENAFASLESLEEAHLTHNELTDVSPRLFSNNSQLVVLDLSYNFLTHYALEDTTNIEVLALAHNQLISFDARSSKYLKNLKTIDLSHNRLTELKMEAFINMSLLEIVNIGYNQLTVLDNDTFSYNRRLERLILDGNNFKTLPIFRSHTDTFQNIFSLSCKKCGIVSLSAFTFGSMPGLVHINLSGNNLETIDSRAFSLVLNLKILDLSGNRIRKLERNVFSDNKELNEINLSGNPLKTLDPRAFIVLHHLRRLNASNTQLKTLWSDNYEYKLNELEHLIISDNSIEDITLEDLNVIPNLKSVDLDNNPLRCTIHLANLIKWLTTNEVYSTDSANILKTNEKLLVEAAQYLENSYDFKTHWQNLAMSTCRSNTNNDFVMNLINKTEPEVNSVPKVYPPQPVPNEDAMSDEDNDENEEYKDEDKEDIADADAVELGDIEVNDEFNLNQATYIISVTSVFVITALVVLMAAVSITLIILKKHNTLNINKANLPRIKIPRWESMPSQKKHSGSIYRPLSEEILAPATPKFNRYEFRTTPTVHNSNP